MEGITGALARITELQATFAGLRPAAPSSDFHALLRSAERPPATTAPPPVRAAGAADPHVTAAGPGASAAWPFPQRPASLAPPAVVAPAAVDLGAGHLGPAEGVDPGLSTDAATYPNGQVPASALTSIGDGELLRGDAAAGFLALRAAAAQAGVDLPVNDSYRSLPEQQEVARRKGLYADGGLAARPGTSTHGLGLSVDLQLDSATLGWMRANGERYGFVEDVAREPWHWTYAPGTA